MPRRGPLQGHHSSYHSNLSGVFLINKPLDWTSFDVVNKTRNLLHVKKVGHTGTLDPLSTGVLVVCVGKATKVIEFMMGADKEYEGEITFGATSATDDREGPITPFAPEGADPNPRLQASDIQKILPQFIGEIDQIPPTFSAKKVNGKKAYEAARKGKPLKLKPNKIKIHSIEILSYAWPVLKIRVQCGSGTYIRSLARDMGKALGVGGYLSALTRTRVGDFFLKNCIGIEAIAPEKIIPISAVLPSLPPRARVKFSMASRAGR
ncbi:tRNA pseudouridine(55) synthase TruB [Candidatus Peregrinibacteria bacterium]|nr:tRNA pseudouridine(55) synthase TruB [Candidatus Peregrinibacteria bacterium]